MHLFIEMPKRRIHPNFGLGFSESRFSEILRLVNKSQLP